MVVWATNKAHCILGGLRGIFQFEPRFSNLDEEIAGYYEEVSMMANASPKMGEPQGPRWLFETPQAMDVSKAPQNILV